MDGELYTEPLRTAKQEAVYICKDGEQTYSPKMTYMGFPDKWLLSKLNSTVKAVDANLAAYKIPETAKVLQEFVDDMSNCS